MNNELIERIKAMQESGTVDRAALEEIIHILTPPSPTKKDTVLIVDDMVKNVEVLGTSLAQAGYGISFVTSGKQVMSAIEHNRPIVILLDIYMPEIDGFEVLKMLKESPYANIPVIFVTGRADRDSFEKALKEGATDYITKPFNVTELLHRVDMCVKVYKAEQTRALSLINNLLSLEGSEN